MLLQRMEVGPGDLVTDPADRPPVPTFTAYIPEVEKAVFSVPRRPTVGAARPVHRADELEALDVLEAGGHGRSQGGLVRACAVNADLPATATRYASTS
jgi:hypothetical protein